MNDCEKASPIVYISCVAEVRYSFVSHLLDALSRKGINDVFVDSDDVLSEKTLGKVERSKICVIVLPGNRTVSLEKLVKVLECQRNNDQVVVPVLHGDGPLQGEWLRELELRGLSPVHRKECSDSKLVEEIVRDVNEKLFYMGRIGIYSKVVEVENMINKQPLGIRCVGIWGMPGIGKTTLAKAVVDQMSGGFDAHCFIEDYDTSIHENRVYRILVEQLMKDDPGNRGTITKMSLRRDKLNNKRVLVVLDDVRDPLLTESFLEGFDWFGPQSLIIITSRDKQVFRLCRINQIYEVQGLNEKEARQLFLLSASMSEENLHELSMKVIKYSNGNPLALSIYGKELKGKRPSEIETAFLQIKGYPPSKIVDAIKSSYGTLSDSEKNIFLDIACFFQGDNVDYVMQLLEGCGFFPHVGIDVLVEKCLVTISENRVQMHNLIQDVGRGIINAETVEIKGHSRLWEPWSVKYLSEDNYYKANGEPETTFKRAQGVEEIECMFLDASNLSFDVKPAAFDNMLNLRLLKIYCSNTEVHHEINFSEGVLHSLPNELRLLHWENYPLQYLPQKFDPRNLVEINMPYSQLRKLWGGTINLEMLKTIKLCHSEQLDNIDDLLKAQNLEVIDLQGCTSLKSFPAIGQLLHLRVVNLSGCSKIKIFPEIPPNIETLHLQGTGIRKIPISPNGEQLVSLSEFKGFSHALIPKHLTSLELKDCSRLRSLPNMAHLEFLNVFDLSGCSKLKTIRGFPPNLKELYLVGTAVREVPQLPQSLELLNAHGSRLRSLPDMANLKFLKVLDLSGCSKLKFIQGFPRNLKELYLAGTGLREVPQLPLCLELLNAHGCVSQKSIHLDSEKPPMHYTFSNFFDLSPHIVNDFFVKALTNVKHIPRENPQDLNKAPTFSFSAPSHTNQNATLDLQPGSSVMTRLNPSWKNTLVGFAMLVEVSFSDDYSDVTGLGIRCVCRWKNEEGHSQRIERNLHCWAPGKAAPKVLNDHMFVFFDVNMRPSTADGNDPDICADFVVFEFFPVDKQTKPLYDSCKVTKCGVRVITATTRDTSLENVLPVLSSDPMEFSGNEVEDVPRVSYDGLHEMDKALFLYIAGLFNDEDVCLVSPLIANNDLVVSSGLKVLAKRSLIRVSSNGEIVMHCLLRKMGKEILYSESMLPGSSKDLARDFEKVSVASSLSRNWKYDVFSSFSGQDVRKTFLNHLHQAFRSNGILVFSDNEINRGQVIRTVLEQAIRESRISIVVFSINYASSSWNLNELVEIAKIKKELDQIVIPIFYKVDPSDVRKQRGEFGRRFKQTCMNKTEDEIQKWCQTLTDVASLFGHSSQNWDNEAMMMEAIAKDVSEKLFTTVSEDFDDFVGIEDHISKMISFLFLESEEVRMVGIWGPSGIGKSTIARALHSRIARGFQHRIFVDGCYMKLHLQEQFLSQILGQKDIEVHHLAITREKLKHKKVLIVLDDVDDLVVLQAVVGKTEWFGPGSRIIVITKDIRLLKAHGIDIIYEVVLPSKKQALQIFCRSAFRQNNPPNGFMNLAVEAVETVGNLPLGLVVLGSSLRGRDKEVWMDILPRIKNSLYGEIEKVLRVAYDRLIADDKLLFLHIACLFNNDTVEYVKRLLADSGLHVLVGLKSLAEKSIIHITEHGHIKMYQLQQSLGREIVRKESHAPGERSFLVNSLDICDVFVDKTGTETILGLSLDLSEINELLINANGFQGMRKLQFLRFYTNLEIKEVKVGLPCGLDYLPPKLRLLHWDAFPMRCMPSNFHGESLVDLIMEASKLETLWSGVKLLNSLKVMSLRCSFYLREIPDLSLATNLERLDLGHCSSLKMLPSSIGHLHKLKDLDMEFCTYLEALPTGMNLKSLYYLNLNGCSQLRSFPQISTNISNLYLDGTAIEEVPTWIENISSLSYLSMNGCKKLKKISPNISKLKLLAEVDFSECTALTEDSWPNHPDGISTFLMRVNMSGNSFKSLPDTWTSVQPKDLIFNNCRKLVSLPELPASLSMLVANNCGSLENLYGSFDCSQMALQFINCFSLNHQARELILQSDCAYAILPGGELPAHFTHRADGSVLTISFTRSSLFKKFPTFKACIVVESRSGSFAFGVLWSFKGGSKKIYFSCLTNTPFTENHLIVFNCEFSPDEVNDSPAELSYNDVQFEFVCLDHRKEMIKVKECGIQLLEVSSFADDSGKRSETEYGNDSGLTNVEDAASSKRMRIT